MTGRSRNTSGSRGCARTGGAGRWRRAAGEARPPRGRPGAERQPAALAQVAELEAVLERGPAAAGYADQCWTLARVTEQSWRLFGVEYTLAGMAVLLHRLGWTVQVPALRAAERDEDKIARWREHLAGHKSTAADLGAWLVLEDESGQGLRPPKGRT